MSISNGIHNFLSTLGNYIDADSLQGFKNNGPLIDLGKSLLDPSVLEGFNQFEQKDVDDAKKEFLAAWEDLKKSEGGLSSTKGTELVENIKKATEEVDTKEIVKIGEKILNTNASSWNDVIGDIKNSIESQLNQSQSIINELIESHSSVLDDIKAQWEESQNDGNKQE